MNEIKDLNYWKANAEEDYEQVPISVLRYITEMELKHINREISQLATIEATNYISEYGLEKLKEFRYLRGLHEEKVEKLTIPNVSQQRELLFELLKYAMPTNYTNEALKNIVSQFIMTLTKKKK